MTSRVSVIPAEACEDSRLSNLDYRILGILGREGGKGFAQINRKQMAQWAQCAVSSVPRSIRNLEKCGYVERLPQEDASGRSLANLYRVKLDQPSSEPDTRIEEDTGIATDTGIPQDTVSPRTPTATTVTQPKRQQSLEGIPQDTGVHAATPGAPAKENSPHPYKKTTSPSFQSGEVEAPSLSLLTAAKGREPRFAAFDELWAAWRERDLIRRSRKQPSFDAFKRAVKAGADQKRVLDGARAYLANPDKHRERGQFMLGLPKWLDDQEWEDWAEEWEGELRRRRAIFEHDGYWETKWGPKPKPQEMAA